MKRGSKVFVCYDGKYSRRVVGTVRATTPYKILVEFQEWASDHYNVVQHWFPRRSRGTKFGGPRYRYAGYVPVANSFMNKLFGARGDWYVVHPFKQSDVRND